MKRAAAVVAVLTGVSFLATPASAQETPEFAGEWTLVETTGGPQGGAGGRGGGGGPGGRGGAMFRGLGDQVVITQDADMLTIVRSTPGGTVSSVYNLDGSQSTNTLSFGGNSVQQLSTVAWEGDKLVITTSMQFGGNPVETTTDLVLDADGDLVVVSTRPTPDGGSPVTTESRYRKQT